MAKKKTNKEFVKEVYDLVGDEYTFLEEYINSRIKIRARHNYEKCDNYEWEVAPQKFLNGCRCPKCAGNQLKTQEQFEKEIYNLVGNEYTFLEKYKGSEIKIKVRHNCKKCNNYEYEVKPSNFLHNKRCPKCFGFYKKTTQEFKRDVYNLVGDEYIVLGEYINNKTKIRVRHNCKKCNNHKYEVTPYSFLRGSRCPKCVIKDRTKTTQEFKREVYNLVGDEYVILGEYVNNRNKIKIKHNCEKCDNYEYEVIPFGFLQGHRCPKCNDKTKTIDEFKKEVFNLVKDEYTILGEYKNTSTKIKVRHNCKKCNNYEYEVTPDNFLQGKRCPKCNESKGEKKISSYFDNKHIAYLREYKFNECKNEVKLPFDFVIFQENKLVGVVEFDGQQHFEAFNVFGGKVTLEKNHKRDEIKNFYCEKNNIPLLRIKYTQFDMIEVILNDFIKNPKKYTINHFYKMSKDEYYKELKNNFT